jgi:hypothetical protein
MSPLDLVLDAAVLAWVLYRQRGVRRVRLRFNTRVPVVLLLLGLFQFVHYTETHSLGAKVSALVIGGFVVGATFFGAIRALTVRLIPIDKGVAQQATWLTIGIWVVSVGVQLSLSAVISSLHGPIGATSASVLLYIAISLGVQNTLVQRRAVRFLQRGSGQIGARSGVLDARSWDEPPRD